MLTITENGPDAQVAGSTLFYNPTAVHAGTFTVAATTTDAESGIAQVAFPTVFGSDGATDSTAPYSTSYSWSAGASASGAQTVTATNGSGLTASSSFTVTPDSTGPSVAITAPAAGATVNNGVSLSADASDADSGVAQVEFRYCAGASCSFATRDGHRHPRHHRSVCGDVEQSTGLRSVHPSRAGHRQRGQHDRLDTRHRHRRQRHHRAEYAGADD